LPVPDWQAPSAGYPALAGQVNQFLGAHQVQYLYTGTLQATEAAAGGTFTSSNGLWIAQSFTTGSAQTAVGYVVVAAAAEGTPAPLAVSLQASAAGAPSGTPLVTAMLPAEFLSGTFAYVTVPLPAAVTASTGYWIVAAATGDASDNYSLRQSDQVSGTSTSPGGLAWTAQAYGLLYAVYDQSPGGPLAATWEDSGARWTAPAYGSGGQLAGLNEYTAGQAPGSCAASSRTLTWTSGLLTGVA